MANNFEYFCLFRLETVELPCHLFSAEADEVCTFVEVEESEAVHGQFHTDVGRRDAECESGVGLQHEVGNAHCHVHVVFGELPFGQRNGLAQPGKEAVVRLVRLCVGGVGLVVGTVQIDSHEQVALCSLHAVERQDVVHAAIHIRTAALVDGTEEAGNGDGSPNGGEQRAGGEDFFPATDEVGGTTAEREWQIFDSDIAREVVKELYKSVARCQMVESGFDVHQTDDLLSVQVQDSLFQFVEFPIGKDAADECADGGSGDGGNDIATLLQHFDGTNVEIAARTTARQHQCHSFAVFGWFSGKALSYDFYDSHASRVLPSGRQSSNMPIWNTTALTTHANAVV